MSLFDISHIFFEVLGYPMSYLEFFAVIFGLAGVWLSATNVIWTWPVGILNVVLSGIFYYQIQLYPDMFLQIFFFVTSIVGWWRWAHPKPGEEDRRQELKVSFMTWKQFLFMSSIGAASTFLMGAMASRLHEWFPVLFHLPSAYPYLDSFILVMSIIGTFFMIEKKIESWIIWILIDAVAACLYYVKEARFFAFEYAIFTVLAVYGLWQWLRTLRSYPA